MRSNVLELKNGRDSDARGVGLLLGHDELCYDMTGCQCHGGEMSRRRGAYGSCRKLPRGG